MFNGQQHWMLESTDWMWTMHGVGWILWTLFLVGLVVWVVRTTTSSRSSGNGRSAMDLLQRAYAEGNISTEEYEERKTRIGSRT